MKINSNLWHTALSKRRELYSTLEAFRLFDGSGDGCDEYTIDRYAHVGVMHLYENTPLNKRADVRRSIIDVLPSYCEAAKLSTLYVKWHHPHVGKSETSESELLFGPAVSELVINENGLRFLIRPETQLNAGLFLDMRAVREKIMHSGTRERVLNAFCFSGPLGIAALSAGAKEVVQLDASKMALRWVKENLALNTLKGEMRVIADDALTFIERERRRARIYDLILLDPPAFGRAGSKSFSFTQDMKKLAQHCLAILHESGTLFLSCNLQDMTPAALESVVRETAQAQNVVIQSVEPQLPSRQDFLTPPEKSHAMRGIWVTCAKKRKSAS